MTDGRPVRHYTDAPIAEQEHVVTTVAHRATLVLVALLTAACGLTATGDPSAAATVGDRVVAAADVDETLEAISGSAAFKQQSQGDTSGQFVLDARQQLATQFVRSEILTIVGEREGIVVSDDDLAQARQDLVDQLGGEDALEAAVAEQGLSEEFVLQQLRDQQIQAALQEEIGPGGNLAEFIGTAIADVPIEVNPRYGTWDPTALAVAPFDPLAVTAPQAAAGERTPAETETP